MSFNKECFVIENKVLYSEKTLVEYNYVPIFFLCKDNAKKFYVALCTDLDELTYAVADISESDVYDLLHGSITMREIISKQDEFWYIQSGEDIYSDRVKQCPIKELKEEWLPESGAYFQILTEDMRRYVDDFDERYRKKSTDNAFLNLSMATLNENWLEISNLDLEVSEEVIRYNKKCDMKSFSAGFDVWSGGSVKNVLAA